MCVLAIALAMAWVPQTASAQAEPEIGIDTPAIALLKKSMATRFVQLKPHLEMGIIGLTQGGSIALRESGMVDTKTLLALDSLIVDENKDRATLYREIARANGRPEWESELRTTFGKRWISRMPSGWFYRDEKGQWVKKQ